MKLDSKMNAYPGMRFFNKNRAEVTEQVKDGSTKIFKSQEHQKARAHAVEKKSYTYDLYVKFSKKQSHKLYGYGVPN